MAGIKSTKTDNHASHPIIICIFNFFFEFWGGKSLGNRPLFFLLRIHIYWYFMGDEIFIRCHIR